MSEWVAIQRLLLITVLAGCIGFERERHGRAAGLRTHLLGGIGSCLIMLPDLFLAETRASLNVDATRMASQVVSGIGFLGAGTILRFRASVRGLTTAASLWALAGVGPAGGAGVWGGGGAGAGILLIVLFAMSGLERRIRKDWYKVLVIESRASSDDLAQIRRVLSEYDVEIRDLEIRRTEAGDASQVELNCKLVSQRDEQPILSEIQRLPGTRAARWR